MDFVHRYMRVYLRWPKKNEYHWLFWDKPPNNGAAEFVSPFALGVSPEMNTLTLYNLNPDDFGRFLQGREIVITAGFYNSDATAKNGGIITTGTIKSSTPVSLDTTDRSIVVNFSHFPEISDKVLKQKTTKKVKVKNTRKKAGGKSATALIKAYNDKKAKELVQWKINNPNATAHERGLKSKQIASQKRKYASTTRSKYSRSSKAAQSKAKFKKVVQYKNLSFKKGTKATTIIKTISKKAKIPLGTVKLNYDRKFANAYTVSGKPINAIKKVADACSTSVFINDGKLYIKEPTKGEKANLHLEPESGLITHPSASDDGSYEGQKFEVQCLMRKEIHVGALLYINDGVKNYGKCVVLGGQREYTTSTSTVTFQFVPYNIYKKVNDAKIKKAKADADKDKKKAAAKAKKDKQKDSKNKSKVKARRSNRAKATKK